ncbi:hypothetical protein BDV28DRAFT_136898 [Aspergillus coremiiformis]|uniref:Uncharacterized protein n=1 Tax=Aspergillus coremiiformis TaxID=138285 RepID=A0A5N6Z675_9EURO|nr:hypothetical protein BDV28DRAFT_136898 [Aspergillus coremiiformis]
MNGKVPIGILLLIMSQLYTPNGPLVKAIGFGDSRKTHLALFPFSSSNEPGHFISIIDSAAYDNEGRVIFAILDTTL